MRETQVYYKHNSVRVYLVFYLKLQSLPKMLLSALVHYRINRL